MLGIGGPGSVLRTNSTFDPAGPVGPLDLFRYSAKGVRSFATNSNVSSFFSINGGTNKLVNFSQNGGGDFGDWGNGTTPATNIGNILLLVQDAFGTTGTVEDVGTNELTALDVVGWNLAPEPSTIALVVVGVVGMAWSIRRRRKSLIRFYLTFRYTKKPRRVAGLSQQTAREAAQRGLRLAEVASATQAGGSLLQPGGGEENRRDACSTRRRQPRSQNLGKPGLLPHNSGDGKFSAVVDRRYSLGTATPSDLKLDGRYGFIGVSRYSGGSECEIVGGEDGDCVWGGESAVDCLGDCAGVA